MSKKTITVDGVPMELDEIHAALVEKLVLARDSAVKKATDTEAAFNTLVEDGKKKTKAEEEAAKTAKEKKDKEADADAEDDEEVDGEDCFGKPKTDGFTFKDGAALAAAVAARQSVIESAKAIVGDAKLEGVTTSDLRRSAIVLACKDEFRKKMVDAVLGGVELDKCKRTVVKSAFDALVAFPRANAQDLAMGALVANKEAGQKKLIGRDAFIARQAGRSVETK